MSRLRDFGLGRLERLRSGPGTRAPNQGPTGASDQPKQDAAGTSNRPMEVTVSSTDVSTSTDGTATYMGGGDPAGTFTDYYPEWLDHLADDVTVEGSMLDGAVQGAEAARTIVVTIRMLYGDSQEFRFAGPCGENGWLEDYIAQVGGKPLGCVALITRNPAGQTQHIVASYRPRSSLLPFSRLLGEKFAGTPYAKYFLVSES